MYGHGSVFHTRRLGPVLRWRVALGLATAAVAATAADPALFTPLPGEVQAERMSAARMGDMAEDFGAVNRMVRQIGC